MDLKKIAVIGLAVGLVVNVMDAVVQGGLLAGTYSAIPAFRNTADVLPYLILGDFVAAIVFAAVYLRLGAGFSGAAGGARFGAIAGVLVSFPSQIFLFLLINGIPYSLAWINTVYGILWYVVAGGVAGALNKK